jgi:hypothetical protein
MQENTKHWFKAKTYGYGWTPCAWQGWVAMIVYILFIIKLFLYIDIWSKSVIKMIFEFIVPIILSTFLLTVLCVYKGEKAKWRWGKGNNK